jgi:hypothetical protein
MRKIPSSLVLTLIGSMAAIGAGCSSSGGGKTDGGGNTSANTILPSATGFVDGTNKFAILGAWYAYGDNWADNGTAGNGKCESVGMNPSTACSSLVTPMPGHPFPPKDQPVVTGQMCAMGVAAAIINDSVASPDYTNIFGVGIGLDFNNAGTGDAGTGLGKQPYNATAAGITGFKFDIDTPPLAAMRVEFPTVATTAMNNINPYWNGAANNVSPVKAGTNTIPFAAVTGPMYATNPPAFDPTTVLSIQFHVVPSTAATTPFSFCVSNLTAITN